MGLTDALVEPAYFDLHGVQLRNDRLTGKARVARQPLIAAFRHNRSQLMQSFTPLRGHQPELGQVGTKCVSQLRPLADQQIPRPVQHQHALLLDALDRHKSHRWPRDGLADRRCIGCVILAALHIGFDIDRRHQPRVMPQLRELACPLMRRCARFQANAARRQIGKGLKNSRSTNAPADHHRAFCIDAVNLKHQLRNIDPDRDNLAHGRLPSMWLRFDTTTLWHFDAAEWAPSTSSKGEELSVSKCGPVLLRKQTSERLILPEVLEPDEAPIGTKMGDLNQRTSLFPPVQWSTP